MNSHRFTLRREGSPAAPTKRATRAWLAAALLAATLAAYAGVLGNGFVNYDDTVYVTENRHVLTGLSAGNVAWALSTFHASNWHPLTWFSLMLDAEIGGGQPWTFHATSLLLHAACALLLFLLLARATGREGRSAIVAGLFALHPLHVESVAWIAARKDPLSTLFGLAAVAVYVRCVRREGRFRLAPVVACLALSLLAKPMFVTLPILLLLLDAWPLRRLATGGGAAGSRGVEPDRARSIRQLISEKIPLLALCILSCAITLVAQTAGGAVKTLEAYPFPARAANAAVASVGYLVKLFRPADLAVFYPHPAGGWPLWQVAGSLLLLAGITWACLRARRSLPYLLTGWIWYLVSIAPVIGIVQVGDQAMADRYTYLPLVGPFLMLVWGGADTVDALARRLRAGGASSVTGDPARGVLVASGAKRDAARSAAAAVGSTGRPARGVLVGSGAAAVLILALLGWRTSAQVAVWKDSRTLLEHALAATGPSRVAHRNLAGALERQGLHREAIHHYREALRFDPTHADLRSNVAAVLINAGDPAEGERLLRELLREQPEHPGALSNLGVALMKQGRYVDAAEPLGRSLALRPDDLGTLSNVAVTRMALGQYAPAADAFRTLIEVRPSDAMLRSNLGACLIRLGRPREAVPELSAATRIDPAALEPRLNLALALSDAGRHDEALGVAAAAERDHPKDPRAAQVLATLRSRQPAP